MMNLNKSFLCGVCVASITWAVLLYLNWHVHKSYTFPQASTLSSADNEYQKVKSANSRNSVLDYDSKPIDKLNNLKWLQPKYKNSNRLIESLKPKPLVTNGDDLNEMGMVKTLEEQKLRTWGYQKYAFNVLVSDKLGFQREVPDTRNKLCNSFQYPQDLQTASIIICFYNEHYSTLMRSLHSIIDRTPPALLKEIILIDDYSDIEGLHANISSTIDKDSKLKEKVKFLKTDEREGLIRARLFGARKAVGEVLVFLDSHIEVNVYWLEPLLARLKQNFTNVAVPIIDIINADTFRYTSSPLVRGGFNWGLHFKWENLPVGTLNNKEDFIKPIKSPTMAGGLFAVNKKYFENIGEYDAGMDIWGGENLEMSFRVWMCGGKLEIIPCSRIGHVFRQRRPYGDPEGRDTMLYNSLRVAHVWMDDYKTYFLQKRHDAKGINYGDISGRIQLRKILKCNTFDWYLKNVYPELVLPTDDEAKLKKKWSALTQDKFQPWQSRVRNYVDQYQLRLSNTSLCIRSKKDIKIKHSSLVLKSCLRTPEQTWYETDKHELVLGRFLCLQSGQSFPYLHKCHEMGGDQEWKHKGENNSPIYNLAAGMCLGVDEAEPRTLVKMKLCSDTSLNTWDIVRF